MANNKIEMPNFYFGDDLDPEFIPKLIPRGPTWDELGIFFIYKNIQLRKMSVIPLVNKPYVNEVTLNMQNVYKKYCYVVL